MVLEELMLIRRKIKLDPHSTEIKNKTKKFVKEFEMGINVRT